MNTRQKFEKMLFENGMFEDQAKQVMDLAIPVIDSQVENYKFTWDRPAEEYPPQLYTVIFVGTVKAIALKWIEENCPMAWYKPMFE